VLVVIEPVVANRLLMVEVCGSAVVVISSTSIILDITDKPSLVSFSISISS
jgi:hypothetical protein